MDIIVTILLIKFCFLPIIIFLATVDDFLEVPLKKRYDCHDILSFNHRNSKIQKSFVNTRNYLVINRRINQNFN